MEETKQSIVNFAKLGKEIKISSKSKVSINGPGFEKKINKESVSLTIGIGDEHIATLIMSLEAYLALKNGSEISITTLKEFKENFL